MENGPNFEVQRLDIVVMVAWIAIVIGIDIYFSWGQKESEGFSSAVVLWSCRWLASA